MCFSYRQRWENETIWLEVGIFVVSCPDPHVLPRERGSGIIRSDFLVVLNEHVYVHCIIQPVSRVITWSAFPFCCTAHAQNRSALQIAFMPHDSFKSGNLIGLPVFRTCWLSTTKKSDLILCQTLFHAGASWGSGHETRIFGNARILNWEEPISDCAHRSDEIWAVPSLQLYLLHRISKLKSELYLHYAWWISWVRAVDSNCPICHSIHIGVGRAAYVNATMEIVAAQIDQVKKWYLYPSFLERDICPDILC